MKNSIIVITYNQEQYICDCLKSILKQSEYIYEVIISDDCSSDNTWKIISEYKKKYPDIIKTYRNNNNLGIFQHLNILKNYITGDLVTLVAGDDMLPNGILKLYSEYIDKNNVNTDDLFLIITNSYILHPNGTKTLISNFDNRHKDPIELTISESLYVWETGISANLFKNTPDYRTDIGYQADLLYHVERLFYSNNIYFINAPGYIYRENVGVTNASKFIILQESKLKALSIIKNLYWNQLSKRSRIILSFYKDWIGYNQKPSFQSYMKMIFKLIRIQPFLVKNAPMKNNINLFVPNSIRRYLKKIFIQ